MTLRIQIVNRSDFPDTLAVRVVADMCEKFESGTLDVAMEPCVHIPRSPQGSYWVRASDRGAAGLVFSVEWEPAARHHPGAFGPHRLRLVSSKPSS
ncbi:MAG: hypothetical protein WBF53_16215 [Litorimonas sp.]